MHGPKSADATGGVAHLVDRQPTVSPERLIAQLTPPPTFAHVSFASYHPDPAEPTQSARRRGVPTVLRVRRRTSQGRKKLFGRREALPGIGLYLDGGFGVGKTHLLAAAHHQLPDDAAPPQGVRDVHGADPARRGVRLRRMHRSAGGLHTAVYRRVRAGRPGKHHAGLTACCPNLSSAVFRWPPLLTPCPSNSARGASPRRISCAKSNTLAAIFDVVRIEGPDYRHRDLPPAPEPPSDEEVAAHAATTSGATLDDFDALCAHLATMHPSRYLTLIEGVTAVCLTGVHTIEDQNVALRLVALTDRLYDAGTPVLASGEKLDRVFSEEMLAGGFRKKYLRATSRLLALTAAVNA